MYKVALADDEPYIREGLEKLVDWEALGCELVFAASNGKELVDEMKKNPPQILILDIKMPVMDGIEVAEYVRRSLLDVDIIFLTAYADFAYAKQAIHYGVSDYIIKTFALEEIPAAIKKIQKKRENKECKMGYLLRIAPIRQKEKMSFIFKHAFGGFEYEILDFGENESVLFLANAPHEMREIIQGCEKLYAFCKNFLGEAPVIVLSGEGKRYGDIPYIYERMKEYAQRKADIKGEVLIFKAQEEDGMGSSKILLHNIEAYIKEHYTEKISLTGIAKQMHISPGYLSRFYKKEVGENLFDTVNSLRIEKAKKLLEDGKKKIYEISERSGFGDTAYFSKVFKRHTGYSPKEYGQAYGKGGHEKT